VQHLRLGEQGGALEGRLGEPGGALEDRLVEVGVVLEGRLAEPGSTLKIAPTNWTCMTDTCAKSKSTRVAPVRSRLMPGQKAWWGEDGRSWAS
jgi:hypothetical protein